MCPSAKSVASSAGEPGLARADGEDSRRRLKQAGLSLFAEKGYAATSIRELAQLAGVNVAAISYYFGDKAGLYRAVFFEPLKDPNEELNRVSALNLPLEGWLDTYFALFLAPLSDGESARCCVKLRMREMLEPTGLWQEEVRSGIQPMHNWLVAALCRHLCLHQPDDDVKRLAYAIAALGVYLHVGQDVIETLTPDLAPHPERVAAWQAFMVRQAVGMVRAEELHRKTSGGSNP